MPDLDIWSAALPDVEGALKVYLKTHALLVPLVSGRVFLGLPRKGPSAWPAVSIFRIGGGPEYGDYPADRALIQLDCWSETGDKTTAYKVAQAVVSALLSIPCGTILNDDVRVLGFSGVGSRYLPDPDTGRARYIVDGAMQAQAVVAPV